MQATESPRPDEGAGQDEDTPPQARPVPDEPGPHDVPDDQVIERTLPTKPVGEGGSDNPGRGQAR